MEIAQGTTRLTLKSAMRPMNTTLDTQSNGAPREQPSRRSASAQG
jgi:hypothetical protein